MLLQQKLTTIVKGMEVYDKAKSKVGTIEELRLGKGAVKTDETDEDTIENALKKIIGDNEFPIELNSELYEAGFLYIERGFLRENAIVFPNQIEDIIEDAIHLNVDEDALIKI